MREFYHSKKKKIRGWKRHKRKIERWKQHAMDLNMDYVRENQRDYAKLYIHPFYSLVPRNPPTWFNRLLLEAMIDVYLHWHEQMTNEKENFYLKMWLYEPNFISSQIVTAYKDCIDFYNDTFDKHTISKPFPIHKYKSLENKLSLFHWELHIDRDEYWESEFTEDIESGFKTKSEVEDIKNKSYKTEKISLSYGNDTRYRVNVGDVWLGTLKKGNSQS